MTPPVPLLRIWRERLTGLWMALLAGGLAAALFSPAIPAGNEVLDVLFRIVDGLRVHLLVAIAVAAAATALTGLRWFGAGCLLAALIGLGAIAQDYRARVTPDAAGTELTLLWFNLLYDNPTPPAEIEAALRDSGADIIILTEAAAARELAGPLAPLYPHRLGCEEAGSTCNLLVLSRLPLADAELRALDFAPERMATFRARAADGQVLQVVAAHLSKPWYIANSRSEDRAIRRQLRQMTDVPLLLVGDFNAAPWSRRLHRIEGYNGLRHARRPVATWPSRLGPLGIPIDHALVRGGAALADVVPWGAGLGSNHLGLLVTVAF
ncbi:endonuclease/exonuclease/phosphatase family protein [Chachezhania sediminis]|uniref:endonuclease/exonuclease/phosphatase family protein n=1 Tax=Chachezhania sediminis TaxID=2599291 RepID=UPI00131CD8B4|nr:endonuclease/exonuclease/phosphatase family protein [Chachezhania sediminis]